MAGKEPRAEIKEHLRRASIMRLERAERKVRAAKSLTKGKAVTELAGAVAELSQAMETLLAYIVYPKVQPRKKRPPAGL